MINLLCAALVVCVVILAMRTRYWRQLFELVVAEKAKNDWCHHQAQRDLDHLQATRLLEQEDERRAQLRAQRAEEDADRLAAIVQEYVDITRTAAQQTKDPSPPTMKAEHDALQMHGEAKKSRPLQLYGNEPTGRTEPPSPNARHDADHRGESRAG